MSVLGMLFMICSCFEFIFRCSECRHHFDHPWSDAQSWRKHHSDVLGTETGWHQRLLAERQHDVHFGKLFGLPKSSDEDNCRRISENLQPQCTYALFCCPLVRILIALPSDSKPHCDWYWKVQMSNQLRCGKNDLQGGWSASYESSGNPRLHGHQYPGGGRTSCVFAMQSWWLSEA